MAPKAKAKGKAVAAKATAKAKAKPAAAKAKAKAEGKAKAKAKAEVRAKAKAEAEVKAKAKAKAKAEPAPEEQEEDEVALPAAKKPKLEEGAASSSADAGDDPLKLAPLFTGSGHGAVWEKILRPVIESRPKAADFIGPSRNKGMVPVREMTFQALKPNPPGGWNVVSFGQSPFPRLESATGIAHFDNAIKSWSDSKFGAIPTMRCVIKAAAIHKYKVSPDTKVAELRTLLEKKDCVGPAEWFQAMLTQGVLFMNAACTLLPKTGERAGSIVEAHLEFWQPVIQAVVEAILKECKKQGRGIVFSWWGGESLKTKKVLDPLFKKPDYADVQVTHVNHKNPAAMYDGFCQDPNIFTRINKALKDLDLPEVDWLPTSDWKDRLTGGSGSADRMGAFISETQELHKMYLERLRDGLELKGQELEDITGITDAEPPSFDEALDKVGLKLAAKASMEKAKTMSRGKLTVEEAAAVHMYTTNHLYKKLNAALRSADRAQVLPYFDYLRWFFKAMQKSKHSKGMLYRGVALDLSSQYTSGSEVTWWAVSSCTPSLEVASNFAGAGKRTLFHITPQRSVGIKQLSEYKSEEEFLLLPGSVLKVVKVEVTGKVIKVYLDELDKPPRVR